MIIEGNESVKRSLIKRYWVDFRKSLAKAKQPIIDMAENVDPDRLKEITHRLFVKEPISDSFVSMWKVSAGRFAYDMEKLLKVNKGRFSHLEQKAKAKRLSELEEKYARYAKERSAVWTEGVMNSQLEAINDVITGALEEGLKEGLSVPQMRKKIKETLSGDLMTQIENWQADRIVRTEIGGAMNKGSFDAVYETGLQNEIKKGWLTSGLPKVRESHQRYEGEGMKEMNYEYNTGLKFPGDPECVDPSDTINCRCTIIYEV